MAQYIDGVNQVMALETSDHEKAVTFANTEQAQRANACQEKLTTLREQNAAEAKRSGNDATAVYDHSVNVLMGVVIVASILTVFLPLP